jgi:MOSC domain-containing protein YiiM
MCALLAVISGSVSGLSREIPVSLPWRFYARFMPSSDASVALPAGAAGRLVSVNRAVRESEAAPQVGSLGRSGIDKRPVVGRVGVRGGDDPGLDGDLVRNRRHHGGVDQALYVYAGEDADWWAQELGRDIGRGMFGENLTTRGVDVTGAVIGEQWSIGSTRLEVSAPRIPCGTFQSFWGVPRLQKRFTEHGAPGAYVRVLDPGDLGAGDAVTFLHRPAHGLTIGEVFRCLSGDRSLAPRLLEAPQLPAQVRARARRWLRQA